MARKTLSLGKVITIKRTDIARSILANTAFYNLIHSTMIKYKVYSKVFFHYQVITIKTIKFPISVGLTDTNIHTNEREI